MFQNEFPHDRSLDVGEIGSIPTDCENDLHNQVISYFLLFIALNKTLFTLIVLTKIAVNMVYSCFP